MRGDLTDGTETEVQRYGSRRILAPRKSTKTGKAERLVRASNVDFFVIQILHDDFGRAKNFVTAAITRLQDLDYSVVGLRGIMTNGDRLMAVRVEWPAESFFGFDAVTT